MGAAVANQQAGGGLYRGQPLARDHASLACENLRIRNFHFWTFTRPIMGNLGVFAWPVCHSADRMQPSFLTVDQVAAQLQLHPRTVRRLLAAGKLPGVKVGAKEWRTPARALVVLLDAQANAREIQEFVNGVAGA